MTAFKAYKAYNAYNGLAPCLFGLFAVSLAAVLTLLSARWHQQAFEGFATSGKSHDQALRASHAQDHAGVAHIKSR